MKKYAFIIPFIIGIGSLAIAHKKHAVSISVQDQTKKEILALEKERNQAMR